MDVQRLGHEHQPGNAWHDIAAAAGDLRNEDGIFARVPWVDPCLASVLDQDSDITRWQREGMYASDGAKDGSGEALPVYQESRIRHLHDTLDKYLEKTT